MEAFRVRLLLKVEDTALLQHTASTTKTLSLARTGIFSSLRHPEHSTTSQTSIRVQVRKGYRRTDQAH